MWRVRAGTHSALVADSVGMRYLAALLTMPGREIAAVDLAGQHHLRAERKALADDAAVAAYRRRVSELQAEIDEADDHYDLERAARARADLDALVEEIGRTTGLLGRPRAFADEAERARTSVQKAIKRAITRVSEADDTLGRLIARGVVTGTKCSYTGDDA